MSSGATDQDRALALPELLRIMDVATAIRQERELVEEQLNFEELKARLRARLIEAAKFTGEDVTSDEVDAAIAQYYSRMHTFREPPFGLQLALAHLYVRRARIARIGGSVLALVAACWLLFGSANAPFSSQGRTHRQVDALASTIATRASSIKAISSDPAVTAELGQLETEAATYRGNAEPEKLRQVDSALAALEARLLEVYTVSVVFDPKDRTRKSGIDRYYHDTGGTRRPGYYLIVEAKAPDGTIVKRKIHNHENGRDKEVTTWAEQVPKEVFDRLARDKKEDGILNETTFAIKRRGRPSEDVVIPGSDGKPLNRLGQITEW
jgi:hypothetical protein